jgi:hypothetical protein
MTVPPDGEATVTCAGDETNLSKAQFIHWEEMFLMNYSF